MTREFPRPDVLPRPIGAIARYAQLIGPEAALKLAEARGGTIIYVPHPPVDEANVLSGVIGIEATAKLAEAFPGNQLKIPVGREWRAVVYRMAGLPVDRVALTLGCDRGTVYRILRDQDIAARQMVLPI
ncbi:hypothetical protein [Pararhodobacter sp.]|uniref:hypothetical protein n=1 Tax=Pararhodobacter sp. TaxID=2127056 RepID=UPI002AFF2F55|nr:hypothetical protein [Pararhodobacter sp.]